MAPEVVTEAAQPSHVEASAAMARRVLRKIDYRLIPLLFSKQLLEFIFTFCSHVPSMRDKRNCPKQTLTPEI